MVRGIFKMKILYITAEGFDTPNPNNQMAEVMIRDFLDKGHTVHLIQSHRKGVNPDIPPIFIGNKNFSYDTIIRKVVEKTRFVSRYLNDVHYAFLAMKCWRKIDDADVIYLQSNPTIIFPMILLKLFMPGVPIVYSIYDVFPGHAYDIGVIKSKLLFDILRIFQKPCYKMADAMIVQSKDMKEKVMREGANKKKIFTVPPWYDVQNTQEIAWEENEFVRKYSIKKGKFIVQFAGTIGYVFDYKAVLELAERLIDDEDIVVQIIGDGNTKEQFMKEANLRGLHNIKFYPLQPVKIVPDVYSECNVCIIPLKKGVIGNGVPSKAAILMACRRVIVSSVETESDYAKMFSEKNMGIAVDVTDYDGFAKAVRWLKNHPTEMEQMVENAFNYGKQHYSSKKSTAKIMRVFQISFLRKRTSRSYVRKTG